MLFMQFKIGPDMGICLIKAILYALLSVFVLMPGLLVLFGPLIEETKHKNFVPKISFVGKIDYATRHVVPVIFVAVADRKSTRLNSSHTDSSRMPSSA